jgi:molybdate transport system substrate-binding protein
MRNRIHLLLALLVPLPIVAGGCGDSTQTSGSTPASNLTGTITVSAAASLTAPFTTMGDDFEAANAGVDVTFNFDSSSTLATQIQDGAPADGFASADEANMTRLTDANLIAGNPQGFARNRLTIVVKKGNPRNVQTLADLATAGTISLCGREVPCGKYADQILHAANVTVPTDQITRGQSVNATLSAVADGDADAGIVYVTDATGDNVEAVPIPDTQNATATYSIGAIAVSANRATMEAFIAYVLSATGQSTLQSAGFLPPR